MDTHSRQGHSHSWGSTDVHRQGTTPSSPHIQRHTDGCLLIFLIIWSFLITRRAGRGRSSLVWHTHHISQLHRHTHLCFPEALAQSLPQWLDIKGAAGSCSWCQDPTGSGSSHQGPGLLTAPVWVQHWHPHVRSPRSWHGVLEALARMG